MCEAVLSEELLVAHNKRMNAAGVPPPGEGDDVEMIPNDTLNEEGGEEEEATNEDEAVDVE